MKIATARTFFPFKTYLGASIDYLVKSQNVTANKLPVRHLKSNHTQATSYKRMRKIQTQRSTKRKNVKLQ